MDDTVTACHQNQKQHEFSDDYSRQYSARKRTLIETVNDELKKHCTDRTFQTLFFQQIHFLFRIHVIYFFICYFYVYTDICLHLNSLQDKTLVNPYLMNTFLSSNLNPTTINNNPFGRFCLTCYKA